MSEHWAPRFPSDDAERVPVWTRPPSRPFTARAPAAGAHFNAWAEEAGPAPLSDPEALLAEGYAQGLAEGRRTVEREVAAERAAIARLAEAIETLRPEPPAAFAAVLSEAVKRLVAQIVGAVGIDEAALIERVRTIAAMAAEDDETARIRLHPDDRALLADAMPDFDLVADATLLPGTIVAETGAGWIEDGPAVRMEKLRALLDRMGCPQ